MKFITLVPPRDSDRQNIRPNEAVLSFAFRPLNIDPVGETHLLQTNVPINYTLPSKLYP